MKKLIFLIMSSTCFLYGCPDFGYDDDMLEEELQIINNSIDTIYYLSNTYLYKLEKKLNDRLLEDSSFIIVDNRWLLKPGSQKSMLVDETLFNRYNNKYSFSVIFFADSIVKNVAWDTVVYNSIYLKRCDFHSWEELEAADFTVAYP